MAKTERGRLLAEGRHVRLLAEIGRGRLLVEI